MYFLYSLYKSRPWPLQRPCGFESWQRRLRKAVSSSAGVLKQCKRLPQVLTQMCLTGISKVAAAAKIFARFHLVSLLAAWFWTKISAKDSQIRKNFVKGKKDTRAWGSSAAWGSGANRAPTLAHFPLGIFWSNILVLLLPARNTREKRMLLVSDSDFRKVWFTLL